MNDGEYKEYHDDGSLWVHCHYLNGKLHGEHKDYHENGSLWVHCHYVNDKCHGEYKDYHDDGSLCEHSYYTNGKEIVDLLEDPRDDIALFELQLIYGGQLL